MKNRFTFTLDQYVVDNLPKQNKSAVVNAILKEHFQAEGKDKLFSYIKARLLKDEGFMKSLNNKPTDKVNPYDYAKRKCCVKYPTCIHWLEDDASSEFVNTITGERRSV